MDRNCSNGVNASIAQHKSASLPNYAKLGGLRPFLQDSSPPENNVAAKTSDDSIDRQASDRSKGKTRRFRFFWKRKKQRGDALETSSSSSSDSSSANSAPSSRRRSGLLNFARSCADRNHDNGFEKDARVARSRDRASAVASRLSQSSRDLRDTRRHHHDPLSAFDLFTACRRSPSILDSLDNLGRRGKREAVKARVEAQRQKYRDSSSDDEEQWQNIKKYHSDEALHKSSREKRLRVARTERFYMRKSREDEWSRGEESRPPRSDRGRTSRNAHDSSPSPQSFRGLPNSDGGGSQRYSPFRHRGGQAAVDDPLPNGAPPRKVRGQEDPLPETVLSGHLPIRKINLDGVVPRAPTPPPRTSAKFHLVAVNGNSRSGHQRPQSYAFESFPPLPSGGAVPATGSEAESVSGKRPLQNGLANGRKPLSGSSARPSRPLSFTTTSQVIYNHTNCCSNRIGPDVTGGATWQHHPPVPDPSTACLSDSQISEKSRAPRHWSDAKKPSLRNFNSVPKPWNWVPSHVEPIGSAAVEATVTRPPPSPVRQSDSSAAFFGAGEGPRLPADHHNRTRILAPLETHGLAETGRSGRFRMTSTSPPPPPTRKHFLQQLTKPEVGGSLRITKAPSSGKGKFADNLEDAIMELEKIYQSMKNDDEAFLAEQNLALRARRNSTSSDLLSRHRDLLNEAPLTRSSIMGSYDSLLDRPASSGSGVDRAMDDLAYRKLKRTTEASRALPAYAGSYLMLSPALSPAMSVDDVRSTDGLATEPNTVLDDLSFRSIRDANLQKVVDPQPPFGIPLGPVSPAAATDYLHARAQDLSRPKLCRRFTPDVVKDDLAYRNLRRDKKGGVSDKARPVSELTPSNLNFDELDTILGTDLRETAVSRKKFRAVRSLSANLSHLMAKSGVGDRLTVPSSPPDGVDAEKSQSLTDLCRSVGGEALQKPGDSKESPKIGLPSLAANFKESSKMAPSASKKESSSSTETLTEGLALRGQRPSSANPVDGDKSSGNDIWQVRVTLGALNSASAARRSSEDLGRPALSADRKERRPHPVLRPIPVKLQVPCTTPGASLVGRSFPTFGYVSDSDAHSRRVRGSPIDEGQLDDLLTSLAQGARSSSTSIVTQRSISCPESPADVTLRSPSFPTVLTDDRTGEMFVKLVFPGLKLPGLKTASSNSSINEGGAADETTAANNAADRPNLISSSKESTLESPKLFSDAGYGVTYGKYQEMFPVTARTRSMVSSGTASDRPLQEKLVPSFGYRTGSSATNAAFIKDVKDGLKISDRPPVMRKFPGNGVQSSPLDENRLPGGAQDGLVSGSNPERHTERVAKYKEERRKQLASQYGQWSSSEEGPTLGEEPSFMRYSRRYKKKVEAGDTNHVANAVQEKHIDTVTGNSSVDNGKQSPADVTARDSLRTMGDSPTKSLDGASSPVEGLVRMNRASRLRAKANGAANCDGVGIATEFSRQGSFRSKLPLGTRLDSNLTAQKAASTPDALLGRSSCFNQGAHPSSPCEVSSTYGAADQHQLTTESEGGTGSDAHGRPKDKSAKRKSNLNRMGALDSTPLPSDSGDETPRRFRRPRPFHGEVNAASADSTQSDSLKSVSIVQSIQQQLSSSSPQGKLHNKDESCFARHRTLLSAECHLQRSDPVLVADTTKPEFERAGSFRRSGRTALKRPEIPDIFRQKASGSESQTVNRSRNAEDDLPQSPAVCHPVKPYQELRESDTSKGTDRFKFHVSDDRSRWEPTKIPIRKATLSKLGPASNVEDVFGCGVDRYKSHTLKISVEHAESNGKPDDVSDTLKELTKLVRETTAKVDCLTDAARRVDIGIPSTKVNMGGKLFKDSAVQERAENGTVVDSSSERHDPMVGTVKNGTEVKSTSGHHATDGNWQLRQGLGDNDDHREKKLNVLFGQQSRTGNRVSWPSEDPNDNEVKVPNRIATAYHTSQDVTYSAIHLDDRSPSYSAYNLSIPLSSLAWKKMNELSKQNAELSSLGMAELVLPTAELPASETVPSETRVVQSEVQESPVATPTSSSVPSILKKTSFDDGEIHTKSILKHKEETRLVEGRPPVPHSILKKGSIEEAGRSHSPEKSSILKKRGSSEDSDHRCSSPEVVSILRRRSAEEADDHFLADRNSILRRKSMLDETEHSRSILKKQCSVDAVETFHVEPRPILKKRNSAEELEQSEPKPILKKRSSTEEEWDEKPKPILKTRRRSGQEDAAESESSELGEIRRVVRVKASSPLSRLRNSDDNSCTSPPSRQTLNVRHPTTSSEDDEFLSLPTSPVNWKMRKDSDDDHPSLAGRPLKTRIVVGSPSSLPSVIRDVDADHEEVNGDVSKSPELELRNEATVDLEDEDDTESLSSTSSSEDEDAPEAPLASATDVIESARKAAEQEAESTSKTKPTESTKQENAARSESIHAILSSIRGQSTKGNVVKLEVKDEQEKDEGRETRGPSQSVVGSGALEKPKEQIKTLAPPKEVVVAHTVVKVNGTSVSEGGENKKVESSEEDEVVHLSVAERASLFMQKLQQQHTPRPAAVRRFANRRNQQRSQTQPVTVEEVQEAAKIAESSARRQQSIDDLDKEPSRTSETEAMSQKKDQTSESDEDPCKLSLAERVKLFNQKMLEERLPTVKLAGSSSSQLAEPPRRRRVVSTRFCTQPVTTEEVEKAQRISPLAASLTKPPEPEVLGTLPVRTACDLMYKCGEEMLALRGVASARSASSSVITTLGDDSEESKPKGILKKREESRLASQLEFSRKVLESSMESKSSTHSYLSRSSETKTTGILKTDKSAPCGEPKPILKESSSRPPPAAAFVNEREDRDTESSSSSSDEEETEGITISVREPTSPSRILIHADAPNAAVDDDSSSSLSHSSSGKEARRIKNEAVMRRRNAMLRKMEERKLADLQHSQSLSLASSFTCQSDAIAALLSEHGAGRMTQRSSTQPLTQMEKRTFEGVVEEVRGSIAERLAALKVSQQEDWKRRLARTKSDEFEGEIKQIYSETESIQNEDETSSRILEKVSLLEVSQQSWRKRVEEKDATKFTVAGKMGKLSPPQASPLSERKKRTPKPIRFQSRTANLLEIANSTTSPASPINLPIVRSKSMPMPQSRSDLPEGAENITKVTVPRIDDEGFSSFFESANVAKIQSEKVEVKEEAFNAITSESRQLLVQKRSVHVVRHHAGAKNPLKTLAARQDLQDEYMEVKMGVAERELKRIKVEQLAKHSNLATSALAGLASTEDFKAVSLRKSSSMLNAQLLPYKDLMLVLVKGRRHVQCRLIEPCVASLNKGDNFILVTPNEVFHYVGEFSNVIERAKGAEVAGVIHTKRDLGYKGSGELITFDEEKHTGGRGKRRDFFQYLGGEDAIAEAGSPDEDEIYEASIVATNKVYDVEENELVPYEKCWGSIPRIEMLEKTKVLVFDFGSEMYVWQGKLAPSALRKRAVHLAQELYAEGYDYTDCDINPLNPYRNKVILSFNKQRPPWSLFAKVNQHMETILFRSKFLDWPDMDQIIKIKRQDSECRSDGAPDLQPCDVETMLSTKPGEPDLVLENSHLGRGTSYWDSEERRHFDIATLGIKVWHVLEYNHSILPLESWGQFHSSDTYVVRWQYRVTVVGRDLSGQVSKHSFLGRERCAYFFWQGKHSTINEKGASALMTVELDEERGPHVRVVQGQESPCFLNLFKGSMTVHLGKRESETPLAKWRLFIVRGELENETHLVEVACKTASLRSAGTFVLIDREESIAFLWFGAKVKDHVKELARDAVDNVIERKPLEFGFKISVPVALKEELQGSESDAFLAGIGGGYSRDFASILKNQIEPTCTPRLFYLSSVSGVFSAAEVVCNFASTEKVCSYPFLQSELYKASQPALFLLDFDHEVYLWQGWWPEATDDNDNMSTGSAHLRWNVERRLAMETVIQYCFAKNSEKPSESYAVWAGLEPIEFKHLFPEWEEREDVAEINSREGKNASEKKLVKDVLVHLKRTRYTFAELQERPLPEGVDPSIMESYLNSEEFEDVLKMTKKEFYALPSWKQYNLKKTAGLY